MEPLVTIITPTYNKHEFLIDAAKSVFEQSYRYWRWWLILDKPNKETRELALIYQINDTRVNVFSEYFFEHRFWRNREAIIRNKYFPMISTPYFCWLSDDDILDKRYLELLVRALREDVTKSITYGLCLSVTQNGSSWDYHSEFGNEDAIYDQSYTPGGQIDGGQFIQTHESFMKLWSNSWCFPENIDSSRMLDAIYMDALAKYYSFYPIKSHVLIHRNTYLSTHTKGTK